MRAYGSFLSVVFLVASFRSTCEGRGTRVPGLFEGLCNGGAEKFASTVTSSPELLDLLVASKIGTLFAPRDSDTKKKSRNFQPRNQGIERRGVNSTIAPPLYHVAYVTLEDLQSRSEEPDPRASSLTLSNRGYGLIVETAQDANLIEDAGQNIVIQPVHYSFSDKKRAKYAGSTVTAQVYSGLGNVVNVFEDRREFARCLNKTGSIYFTDGYFTLPEQLGPTASKLQLTTFDSLVKCSGLAEILNNRPSITVFIPSNEAFSDAGVGEPDDGFSKETAGKIKALVVEDFLGFTPNLEDGKVLTPVNGTDIAVKVNDDGIFVNGAKIIKRDIVLENGVAHIIDKAFPWTS